MISLLKDWQRLNDWLYLWNVNYKYYDSNYNDNCEDNININNINQQRFMFDDNDFDFLKIMDTNADNNGNVQSNNYQQDEFHLYFDDYFKW